MNFRETVRNALSGTPIYPLAKETYRRLGTYAGERRRLMDFYRPLIPRGSTVFDVGANRGNFADAYLRLGLKVYAIEPNPACIREMEQLYGRKVAFEIVPCGLGAEPGEAELFLGENGMDNVSTMSREYVAEARKIPFLAPAGWNRSIVVKLETMDRLISRYGLPDFVKIDVEGFEMAVLRGLSQPVPMLQFEYQPWAPEQAVRCVEYLAGLGPSEFNITRSAARQDTGTLTRWMSPELLVEMLGRQDPTNFGDVFCRAIAPAPPVAA